MSQVWRISNVARSAWSAPIAATDPFHCFIFFSFFFHGLQLKLKKHCRCPEVMLLNLLARTLVFFRRQCQAPSRCSTATREDTITYNSWIAVIKPNPSVQTINSKCHPLQRRSTPMYARLCTRFGYNSQHNVPDSISWKWTSDGLCSVKSAYLQQFQGRTEQAIMSLSQKPRWPSYASSMPGWISKINA